jgi:hypothetical protein
MVLLLSKFHLGIIFVVSHVDVICKGKIVNLELKKHVQRHIKNWDTYFTCVDKTDHMLKFSPKVNPNINEHNF